MSAKLLCAAIDIRRWLKEDAERPFFDRLERDAAIGESLRSGAPVSRILAWWNAVDGAASRGERVVGLRRIAVVVLVATGLMIGIGAASLALAYDGRYPVNLFALLGILVGVPSLLLLFTLVLLPGRVPAVGAFGALNISRWAGAWLERYAGIGLFAGFSTQQRATRFARWQLTVFSQWMAVGFFVGVLVTTWLSVAASDLAFGWSTTLAVEATLVHEWVATVSAPWADWLPRAAPDLDLVVASQFYRLETDEVGLARAALLGQWWPFILMTITCYGLLPRLVLLGFALWHLRQATAGVLLDNPEVTALLDRLDVPRVSYQADREPSEGPPPGLVSDPPPHSTDERAAALIWNQALDPRSAKQWLARHFRLGVEAVNQVSTLQDSTQRQASMERLGRDIDKIFVFTKGWEPPLLEFADFLNEVRSVSAEDASLVVIPIDVEGRRIAPDDREVWAQALSRIGDTKLYVAAADQEATA